MSVRCTLLQCNMTGMLPTGFRLNVSRYLLHAVARCRSKSSSSHMQAGEIDRVHPGTASWCANISFAIFCICPSLTNSLLFHLAIQSPFHALSSRDVRLVMLTVFIVISYKL